MAALGEGHVDSNMATCVTKLLLGSICRYYRDQTKYFGV